MSELGELLELLHAAEPRWRSIRASGRQWTHRPRSLRAFRAMAAASGRNVSAMTAHHSSLEPDPMEQQEQWRIWLEHSDRARAEFMIGAEHGPVTTVRTGDRTWT